MSTQRPRYLVPVLNPLQKLVYAILVGTWLAALISLWSWWLQEDHITTPVGMLLTSLLLLWVTGLPGYFFFFAYRAKRPNFRLHGQKKSEMRFPIHLGTRTEKASFLYPIAPAHQAFAFAAVVTHAPNEDAHIAIRTLEALVAIRTQYYPRMDIFLASEDGGKKLGQEALLRQFCAKNRITISSRLGLSSYQRESFPRRARSKEGNLSYFYDVQVFTNGNRYQYVLQFDVDHVPTPGYVSAVLHGFDDPQVGYVSAPSICDANRKKSFWVMPRAIVESTLHGILQAGYNGGWAPMPIGSHYAVRVAALRELVHPIRKNFWQGEYTFHTGGVGPELAEDHSTGLAMNASGWKGVHAIDAIAYGDGPESFMDAMTQEQQWSRSLMQVFLKWTGGYFKLGKMPLHIKMEYLFAQAWYPLFAISLLVGFLMPLVALWTQTAWVNVNYVGFLAHNVPVTLACLLPIAWLKLCCALRPNNAPLFSLETILFQLVRWPWVLLGVIEGLVGSVLLNRELSFKVTPKASQDAKSLPLKAILPYALIMLANFGTVLAVDDPGPARGYYYFALLTGTIYLFVLAAIVVFHLRENRKREGYSLRIAWKPMLVTAMLTLVCATAVSVRGPSTIRSLLGLKPSPPAALLGESQTALLATQSAPLDTAPIAPWAIANNGQ